MHDFLSGFATALKAQHRVRTVTTYLAVARTFAAHTNRSVERTPSPGDVEAFLARPRLDGGRRSVPAYNQELAALRALAEYAVRETIWTADPTARFTFRREPERDPVVLSPDEVRELFRATATLEEVHEARGSLALLAVFSQVGLRVSEVAALDVDQVDLVSGTLLGIAGKGGTRHARPLNAPSIALLAAWLEVRREIADEKDAALFVSSRGTRMSVRTIERIVPALARRAGLRKHLTPHGLRHSAATIALLLTGDLATVSSFLRHASVKATLRYLHLVDTRLRNLSAQLATTVPPEILPRPPSPEAPKEAPANSAEAPAIPPDSSLDDEAHLYDIAA